MDDVYDIRLKENFKLFVTGPSRCGKTFFVCDLLQNINSFCKTPPVSVIYVYKVWQEKFEEIKNYVHKFIMDGDHVMDRIKENLFEKSTLLIFDDLLHSKALKEISTLFIVDARHQNLSLIFLTQKMFVNNEYFRQISQNSDYFCIFKNPRNSMEIRTLAQQITPGNLGLIKFYTEATKKPFSYILINLTQECVEKVKYLGNPFLRDHTIEVYTELT